MQKKSNGERWRSYVRRELDVENIEAYLENAASATHYLELIDLQTLYKPLIDDTDYNKAPITEWCTIHTCVQGGRKWGQGVVAWGEGGPADYRGHHGCLACSVDDARLQMQRHRTPISRLP
jgi:hypothetical protein